MRKRVQVFTDFGYDTTKVSSGKTGRSRPGLCKPKARFTPPIRRRYINISLLCAAQNDGLTIFVVLHKEFRSFSRLVRARQSTRSKSSANTNLNGLADPFFIKADS